MKLRASICAPLFILLAFSAPAWAAKVAVCHFPPGNPAHFTIISVSENAVKAHLAHGDYLGACQPPAIVCGGGNPTALGEYPWTLSLQRFDGSAWRHVCGATLLTSNAALTAASCVVGQSAAAIRVVAGLTLLDDESGAQVSGAASFNIHPSYTGTDPGLTYDIAIVVLATPIAAGGNVQFALLPADDSNDYAGLPASLTGWGKTARAAQIPNNEQQKESVDVLTNSECSSLFADAGFAGAISPIHLCSFSEGLNACAGDIGGAVVVQDGGTRVAGVQSWPVDYAVPYSSAATVPRVATRTSALLQWIAANTP